MLIGWQDINQQPGSTRVVAMDGTMRLLNLSGNAGDNTATTLQTFNGSSAVTRANGSDATKGARRAAVAYSATGRSLAFGGVVSSDANPLATSPITTLYLGHASSFALPINGCLRRLACWPRRLSDAELAATML